MKKIAVFVAFVALAALAACKPTCQDLKAALDAAKASGNALLIETAQAAYNEAKCNVPPVEPPPTTCNPETGRPVSSSRAPSTEA